MLLVVNNNAINISTVTFVPADSRGPDTVFLGVGDVVRSYHGDAARAIWEKVQHLADAVIVAEEELWPPSSKS